MTAIDRRLRRAFAVGAAAAVLAGCGSSTQGVSDAKIISALDMKTVQGHYAIGGNPFCSVSKLLHDPQQVKDASHTRSVIASRDGTAGIQIIRPFAPRCKRKAQRALTALTSPKAQHGRRASRGHHGGSQHAD